MGVRRALLVGFACVAIAFAACREPTEVTIEARTNVVYHPGIFTSFTVGTPGETETAFSTTESHDAWGTDGLVGTLVAIPDSSKDAALSVKIVLGVTRDTKECTIAQPEGCIIARRKLRYVPHTRLRLPVQLYAACEGKPCDPDSTCNRLGQCVPAEVDPASCDQPNGCTLPGDPDPTIVAPPGPSDGASEEGAIVEASTDAPVDARPDGRDDAGPIGPSGYVLCPSGGCTTIEYCCMSPSSGSGSCHSRPMSCAQSQPSEPMTMACDGPEDCAGSFCCGGPTGGTCAGTCSGYPYLCHVDKDCPASKPTCGDTLYLSFYPECQ